MFHYGDQATFPAPAPQSGREPWIRWGIVALLLAVGVAAAWGAR